MRPNIQHPTPAMVSPATEAAQAFAEADRALNTLYAEFAPNDPPAANVEATSHAWWNARAVLVETPATSVAAIHGKARALRSAIALAAGEQDDLAASLVRDVLALR